jgi:hypothetical protein
MNTREEMLQFLPKNSVGVEIGVFKGEFSDIILEVVKPKLFYMVDPWVGEVRSGDKDGLNMSHINGEEYFIETILPKYGTKDVVKILRESSNKLTEIDDDFFDWGYIDGDHSYEGVKHDLNLLRGKVKNGGVIMGHDYITPRFHGVVRAVDEFCVKHNLNIKYITKDGCPSFFIINNKS